MKGSPAKRVSIIDADAPQYSEEYTLREDVFLDALARLEIVPTIDYFASDANAKCNRYTTSEEDSLEFQWPEEEICWANPPWRLWPQVIQKIEESTCAVVTVCPAWAKDWIRRLVGISSRILYYEAGSRLFMYKGKMPTVPCGAHGLCESSRVRENKIW